MNTRSIWLTVGLLASGQASAALEQELAACAAISEGPARLACYDELAARAAAPPAPAAPRSTPESPQAGHETTATAESEFGLKQKQPEPRQDRDKIYLEVAATDRDPYGALIITFTNSQIWKQIDQRYHTLENGETVFIEKAALRSFLLGSDSRSTKIRVRRLR